MQKGRTVLKLKYSRQGRNHKLLIFWHNYGVKPSLLQITERQKCLKTQTVIYVTANTSKINLFFPPWNKFRIKQKL